MTQVTGQVTRPRGEALFGAKVELSVEGKSDGRQTLETDLQGQFSGRVPESGKTRPFEITVIATMPGYVEARDTIEIGPDQPPSPVGLVLMKEAEDPHLPALEALDTALLPELRAPVTGDPLTGIALEHFKIAERLFERNAPEDAVSALASVVRQNPGCLECRTLAGMAELHTGAWSSAASDLMRAAHASVTAETKGRIPEPFIALGELQIWRGEFSKAALSFLEALEIRPDHPLALQELGRTFLIERRPATAGRYLERALAHGGGAEAHLLLAQVMIDMNEPRKAQEQMDAFLGGGKPKDLASGPRLLWADLAKRIELESRGRAPTVVDRSVAEVAATIPELKSLAPATDPGALDAVLRKVGQGVQDFFRGFPNTSVQEEIEMQRLRADDKVADSLRQDFRYLLLTSAGQDSLQLSEYRADSTGTPVAPGAAGRDFMITSGFASIPLIFHPSYQIGSAFRLLGRQQIDGHDALVIAFAELPATAKMLEDFVMKDQRAVVLTQGLAWVDAASFQVLRMRTELLKPAPEIRLVAQTTDVRYGEVRFHGQAQTLWLPRSVAVTVNWNGRVYRNLHRYSDYQLFQVGTREKTKAPKKVTAPAGN